MKKAIGMFVALIIALGMTGVAYACWSDTVYINGTVNTGHVCVGWEYANAYDDEMAVYDKEVGSISAWLTGYKCDHIVPEVSRTPVYSTLNITLTNVYPGYWAWIYVEIGNCGTIPVSLVDFSLSPASDPSGLLPFVYYTIYDLTGDWCQIDPCHTAGAWIYIYINQDIYDAQGNPIAECPQGATATFTGSLTFCQWNEAEVC